MRNIKSLILFVIIISMLTGCSDETPNQSNKIVPPSAVTIPIEGEWIIDKCLTGPQAKDVSADNKWVGRTAWFTSEAAAIGDNYWNNVSYKMKRVDPGEYFLRNYRGPASNLGINGNEIFIVTLSSGDKFLYEFVKMSDSELVVNINDEYYHLKKLSDQVEEKLIAAADVVEKQEENTKLRDEALRSGIFLGIRRLSEKKTVSSGQSFKEYKYLTYWISAWDLKIRPILQADGIFLPRRSGFWKVAVNKVAETSRKEDILSAYGVSGGEERITPEILAGRSFWFGREGVLNKAINYIGNDYASVEYSGTGINSGGNKWTENRLATLLVDNLSEDEGVRISDISGENGTLAAESSVNDILNMSNIKRLERPGTSELERNFSLYRKTGHWFIKGRLEMNEGESVPFTDFNIKLIPPPSVVAYDELYVPWTNIKDRVPDAIDAYTSPNKDVAVIITKAQASVYLINGAQLAGAPVAKLSLQNGDTVIMAEWGLGTYTEKWEKAFIKYSAAVPVE